MPFYLVQAAYTPEAWATMVKNPQNRNEAVRPVIEGLGGRLHGAWFAFGDYDIIAIVEMPDNTNAAAFSLAASAGGSVRALKTTPLMTTEEGIEAMRRAAGSSYRAPS
jgi:uncharacterized protein with GYD domain